MSPWSGVFCALRERITGFAAGDGAGGGVWPLQTSATRASLEAGAGGSERPEHAATAQASKAANAMHVRAFSGRK